MKCYGCGKFLKKGHGENIWYHPNPWDKRRVGIRGEYRYYCHFCLKVEDYWKRMNAVKYRYTIADVQQFKSFLILTRYYNSYFSWLIFLFLFLLFFRFILFLISLFLTIFLICLIIDCLNYSKIKKKNAKIFKRRIELWEQYEKFKNEQWRPLAIEQEWLRKAEIYVKSKHRYPNEWFCHCEKCLETEWKKRKSLFQNNHA